VDRILLVLECLYDNKNYLACLRTCDVLGVQRVAVIAPKGGAPRGGAQAAAAAAVDEHDVAAAAPAVEQGDVHKGQVKGLCCAWCGIESPMRHGIALVSTLSAPLCRLLLVSGSLLSVLFVPVLSGPAKGPFVPYLGWVSLQRSCLSDPCNPFFFFFFTLSALSGRFVVLPACCACVAV
jgi:hypothetical protein